MTGLCGALLLSPVPEPEIYLMMLAGVGLLGMKMRRRNNVSGKENKNPRSKLWGISMSSRTK